MRVISLGWGVQSTTLAVMAALGDIEPVAAAVHSDTTWERQATYDYAAMLTPWLEARGVRVVTVRAKAKATEAVRKGQMIPAYTLHPIKKPGQAKRTCTQRWKVAPMRKWLQSNRHGEHAYILLGISLDEWWRAKDSTVKYATNIHPLLDLRMKRADCVAYLQRAGVPVPVKSSCVYCPFHSPRAWEDLKREGGDDWKTAVEIDALIRDNRPPYKLFVHSFGKPLPEAVHIPEDEGAVQLTMLDDVACDSGYCFL